MNLLAAICFMGGVPFGLQNGDFRQVSNGRAEAWDPVGQYRVIVQGGRKGMPALAMTSGGEEASGARQALRFDPPRKGPFVVTAWMRCDEVGAGGDAPLWLDALQAGGPPIWGQQGLPDRGRRGWQ
ncbi:MAG: hypothetical protein IT210_07240 [Armatimonadetes bacterium]|nr:hypothetical protein [Armatimonadota bacterium]